MIINWELVVTVIVAFLGGGAVVEFIKQRNQKPVTISEAWERVTGEYARQVESLKRLEVENAALRPLVLKIALQEQAMTQCHDDKEDWKRYSLKLSKQLEENGVMPIPFKRYPTGDSGKIAAIMAMEESPTIKKEN